MVKGITYHREWIKIILLRNLCLNMALFRYDEFLSFRRTPFLGSA